MEGRIWRWWLCRKVNTEDRGSGYLMCSILLISPPLTSSITYDDHHDTLFFFFGDQRGDQYGALEWYDKALSAGWEVQEGILNVMQVRRDKGWSFM